MAYFNNDRNLIFDLIPDFMKCSGRQGPSEDIESGNDDTEDTSESSITIVSCTDALEQSQPSLVESDSSSLCESILLNPAEGTPNPRGVHFSTTVHVREHDVTLGDHPYCRDSVPLTLDWDYVEREQHILKSKSRMGKFYSPRRLSLLQRRERLSGSVFQLPLMPREHCARSSSQISPSICKNRIDEVMSLLSQSWSMTSLLPAPDLSDIDDDTEIYPHELESIHTAMPITMHWTRNTGGG